MLTLQLPRLCYTTRVGDHRHLSAHGARIIRYAFALIRYHQTTLKLFVVSRDSRGAGVFVALHCLNATQREHKAPRSSRKVRADAQRPSDLRRIN